ncbi:thyroid hormone receptor-associated protein 3 isoform X2 [Betta splendens]|uniref:Thyroid hormone receptor-associated protein 3 isoform X2 n=1 Tax=Betta splendens TaxID=158456 RepID=A0A6P7KPE5_BETSP|nr:thyroid hormone receptor-associated protein 3 isoform X2 [Betta splendens]
MKNHTSSRSRSRSRSPSPTYNRDKKYPRAYQNNREFRGYHRGFRRPYNFRGRGRGYFPRGRYQRGGGNYNNNNNNYYFRPNWKWNKQNPQKQHNQQQQQQQQQQNSSRGRQHNFQKRSGSPPHGQSHQSDRSSSPLSRHSQHSSSSHSSSPKCRPALLLANQNSQEVEEKPSAPSEVQKDGEGDAKPVETVGVLPGDTKETEGNWQGLTDCNGSPKRTGPLANSSVTFSQNSQTPNQSSPSPKNRNDNCNNAPSWQMLSNSSSTKKPSHEGLNPMLSSFDFFSNKEYSDGDKTAISIAFRKFLEEQHKKGASSGRGAESIDSNKEQGKENGKSSAVISDSVSKKYKEDIDGGLSLNSLLKASPLLSTREEEEEEMIIKPHAKLLHKDWHNGDGSSKPKSKAAHSARELFEQCFGKWQNAAYSQAANANSNSMAEDMYLSRKQETAAMAAALARRELGGNLEELSPDMSFKARKREKSPSISSPTLLPRREMFLVRGDDVAVTSPSKQEAKFNVRMNFVGDRLISSSDILAEERQLSQDLVQSSKKKQEFRSIFQHVQAAQLKTCPSELFAQHIVAIVHHIKTQHFPSPDMTLNDRFTMYQRRAAEKEMMAPRKSPEIHRRIDVSPSAFKKHSQPFEAMKTSEDGTYKDGRESMKDDPMDLRVDIERRKKYSTHEKHFNQDRGRDMEDSPDCSKDRSVEKYSKCHKKSKKKKKKRSRSSSSSSSSSSKDEKEDAPHDTPDPKNKGFNSVQLSEGESPGPEKRPRGGFQVRIRGRAWNRGNCQTNTSNSNTINMAGFQKSEDWDPEYNPKSKTYYLHDDRDREAEYKWMGNRGRGSTTHGRARFIIRKATAGSNTNGPTWGLDKFQINGEQGGARNEVDKQDHKEKDTDGDNA